MSYFRSINRDIDDPLPPSVQDWLPEGYLARDVVEVVEGLDLRALEQAYFGRGSLPYQPATLLSLLIYGYATGGYSSRKIERAIDDSLAFRVITAALVILSSRPLGSPTGRETPAAPLGTPT